MPQRRRDPVTAVGPPDALDLFGPATREWFRSAFEAPTEAQAGAWEAIASGKNVLVVAPTGSGKTLAAFLWAIDRLATDGAAAAIDRQRPVSAIDPGRGGAHASRVARRGVRILYVSPLKALAVDVERNLRAPLAGIRAAAARLRQEPPGVTVAIRTGDTPPEERRRFVSDPADVLITTPESLFLLLTSRARETLRTVETVIVDEVHALAGGKRGSHLALSLERLDCLLEGPAQRIGLSATVRPVDEVARFLAGSHPVTVVQGATRKALELSVVVPVEDMTLPAGPGTDIAGARASSPEARTSVWPHVEERLLELVRAHHSTIVFANSRRLAERLCARLNELAGEEVARAHHGSVSREQRLHIEEDLKTGRLPAVVATSSLELGIDMGAVDLVAQVEAPGSVASGLQRVGRAGHHVGAVSRGVFFPKYRGDLLECAAVVERMREGAIEALRVPRNPLDVLAQQIVAMVAMDDWDAEALLAVTRRAAPYAELPRSALEGVLDMLSGRYPSDLVAELRPRLNWDRATGRLAPRPGAQRLAVTSGGTIPDRGLFGVFLVGERSARVGELDEEMVYESRVGDVFLLGASSWRIDEITRDRVLVSPAPGQPGKMPFWHGDAPGRHVELGRALGAFVRELGSAEPEAARRRLLKAGLDEAAAGNLLRYLAEQREATGVLPDDRTVVIERFRDEVGDWRVCVHSFFGARVHTPWAQVLEARFRARLGIAVQTMCTDDGIVVRVPEADVAPAADPMFFEPEDAEERVLAELPGSALFASRFRECAARALLLPRRGPGSRTPLWQQRQKSSTLLQAAERHPSFPILLETTRECLQDVFDVPALAQLMAAVRSRELGVVEVETPSPSPFASSLLFGYVSAFMYEGDTPLAERRAQALALDRALLAELLGREELRELVDPAALAELELELQLLTPDRKARDPDALHDALRRLGDLSTGEIRARVTDPETVEGWLAALTASHRAARIRLRGEERWIAAEDAAAYRDALGVELAPGLPAPLLDPVPEPVLELVGRWAHGHGPFRAVDVAERLGLDAATVGAALERLESQGRVLEGEFRPGGSGDEWIDTDVLRRLRRRSLAAFRKEVEPAPPEGLARFAVAWHGTGANAPRTGGVDLVWNVVERLQGMPLPASALERQILPSRVPGYVPALIDQLGAGGEVVWAGAGALGANDGWIVLATADAAPLLLPEPAPADLSPLAGRVLEVLQAGGALFFRQIAEAVESSDDAELLLALWDLVWSGLVSNDTLAPLRAYLRRAAPRRGAGSPAGRARIARAAGRLRGLGPPAGAGRWRLAPALVAEPTRRLHAAAEQLLARHGIVTPGCVTAERLAGGFAAVYPVLKALEEAGRCRRGYFVEGLGGAQFALPGAVDRMRTLARDDVDTSAVVLAATDPANPYGAALPWPERPEGDVGHRPGRKVGAVVVLVGGRLALYLERGGRTLLSFCEEDAMLRAAVAGLADAADRGMLGRLSLERADGGAVLDTPLAQALVAAGFRPTPRGLRARA